MTSAHADVVAVLVVIDGADAGRRIELVVGSFRVVGRSRGPLRGTHVVERSDVLRLEDEDHRRIDAHLARRFAPGLRDARGDVASFVRGADVELLDEAVSQTHAMVFCDDAGLSVVDVESTNGTWVNGARVLESVLVAGDLLRFGETRVEVRAP